MILSWNGYTKLLQWRVAAVYQSYEDDIDYLCGLPILEILHAEGY